VAHDQRQGFPQPASRFARITTRAGAASGCGGSSIVPVRRCGGALQADPESHSEGALLLRPKPPLGGSTKAMDPGSTRPSWRSGTTHGFCGTGGLAPIASEPTQSPRLWATAPGATPARLCEHTMRVLSRPSKPELPTWPGLGTFYLAPTIRCRLPAHRKPQPLPPAPHRSTQLFSHTANRQRVQILCG